MFDIEYKGGNTVVFSTKKTKLVVDPKRSSIGLKDVEVKDAVELSTEPSLTLNDPSALLIINGPGEYEIGDFSIRGFSAIRHIDTKEDEKLATVYRIEVGEIRIALLGNIAPALTEDQLEELGVVDILVVPVGGGGLTLDPTNAAGLVRRIDPRVVIPTHYADTGLEYEMPQDNVDTFIKELGVPVESLSKYKVKIASTLPAVLTIVQLERS